ncbi:MAG: hypothetical protein QOI53_3173 [Verrucomicrobiota bacterium]|jgi:hypothetical protein|nr:hypothetical protein [Verrucomicrobiota bacterium]
MGRRFIAGTGARNLLSSRRDDRNFAAEVIQLAKADPRLGHAALFGRPSGTRSSCASGPGDKSPGYCHMFLRDEEPSQEALTFVPSQVRCRSGKVEAANN